jgi:hypothetical protein
MKNEIGVICCESLEAQCPRKILFSFYLTSTSREYSGLLKSGQWVITVGIVITWADKGIRVFRAHRTVHHMSQSWFRIT